MNKMPLYPVHSLILLHDSNPIFCEEQFAIERQKKISDYFGSALRRYVIGPENLHDPPNQVKIETNTCSLASNSALGSLLVYTFHHYPCDFFLRSDWLFLLLRFWFCNIQ